MRPALRCGGVTNYDRAMKRDVTRTGVRTQQGAIDDAVSGMKRYYVNNYKDWRRQLGVDLMLGNTDSSGIDFAQVRKGSGPAKLITLPAATHSPSPTALRGFGAIFSRVFGAPIIINERNRRLQGDNTVKESTVTAAVRDQHEEYDCEQEAHLEDMSASNNSVEYSMDQHHHESKFQAILRYQRHLIEELMRDLIEEVKSYSS